MNRPYIYTYPFPSGLPSHLGPHRVLSRVLCAMQEVLIAVVQSLSRISNSLPPQRLQHTRLPCPLLSPGVCSNSCPMSWWCHPTISSSATPFSSCLQSFLASGSFPMSQLFASSGQSIGTLASVSVLPMNSQGWFPLRLTGLISLLSKGLFKSLLQHHNSKASILWHSAFLMVQLSHPYMIGNSNNFIFLPVWTSSFSEAVNTWELCGCLWGVDTPKAKHLSPLFIAWPRVLPGLLSLSLIPVLMRNISRPQRRIFTSQIFQDQRETAHASPSGGGCEMLFCLHD